MKVACIGNMNNNFFSITRYLRDRGYDAELLLLNQEISHFRPESDTFTDDYHRFIRQLQWGNVKSYYTCSADSIRRSVESYDFVIACGSVPAFFNKIGRRIDLFIPYGSDIFITPFRMNADINRWDYPILNILSYWYRQSHRRGLESIHHLSFEVYLDRVRDILKELKILEKNDYLGFPMVYSKEYLPGTIEGYYAKSSIYSEMKRIRENASLVIFQHSRQMWHDGSRDLGDFSNKGNDRLVRAFARFLRETDSRARLVLVEYGPNVEDTKTLIRSLGISDSVTWLPLLPRREIMVCLSLSDLCAGEFVDGFYGYGVIWESLIAGVPLVVHRNNSRISDPASAYPYFEAREESEILAVLKQAFSSPEKRKKIGQKGLEWIQAEFSGSVDRIARLIEAKRL